jgi:PHD/YefM family antitoxin component YafN of YafNO toxin-antitoxin module
MTLHPQYVVDDSGRRKGVLLPLEEYQRLVELLEDQLDAADLDQAVASDSQFTAYSQVQSELRAEGLL